jgi:hypothetical protein
VLSLLKNKKKWVQGDGYWKDKGFLAKFLHGRHDSKIFMRDLIGNIYCERYNESIGASPLLKMITTVKNGEGV